MGLKDKFNRWRGVYDESLVARQEFASFPVKFASFEEFAEPFARSMSMELFKALKGKKVIEDGVPFILWGERPSINEYVYIYRTDVLTEEKLESFEKAQAEFMDSVSRELKITLITLVCVEESSEAFRTYCQRMPRMEDYDLVELVAGIAFDEQQMHTGILTDYVAEKNARVMRKEFLRMVRVAENYFNR